MFIVDRVKELIKVCGFQVAPAEIEAVLVTHPAVADVAVIGVADETKGEVPKAFVVGAAGTSSDLAELQRYLEGDVAAYKVIQKVEYVEAIPKSPSGEILPTAASSRCGSGGCLSRVCRPGGGGDAP